MKNVKLLRINCYPKQLYMLLLVLISFIVLIVLILKWLSSLSYPCYGYMSPGDFSDGTFGEWVLRRIPFPPPETKSVQIIKHQSKDVVLFQLRKNDSFALNSSRCELSIPSMLFLFHFN